MGDLFYAVLPALHDEPRAKHYLGFPPERTGGKDKRKLLPVAQVLVIQEGADESIYLYRYDRDGRAAGDTWHMSIEQVKGQAQFEYGDTLIEWRPVPDGIIDMAEFVRALTQ